MEGAKRGGKRRKEGRKEKLAVIDVDELFVDKRADCARVVHLGIIVAALIADLSSQYHRPVGILEIIRVTKPN